jgi:hypothetical protein
VFLRERLGDAEVARLVKHFVTLARPPQAAAPRRKPSVARAKRMSRGPVPKKAAPKKRAPKAR